METPSPGITIQVQDQAPDSNNQQINPSIRHNRNHPRSHPPVNASSSDSVLAVPPTDGTGTKPHQRNINNNRPRGRGQGSSRSPRSTDVSQTAGTSSGADSTDVQLSQTRRSGPHKRQQGAGAASKPPIVDSAPAKPQTTSQRPSRRSKFNASLSEPTALVGDSQTKPHVHLPAQASSKPKRVKPPRSRAPLADDLTSTLIRALSTPPYPDCPICFNFIRPEQPTWSCSLSDPSENLQCCWTTFHLKCIRAWASKSVKDLEEAWRTRGEERAGEWRCPGCQAKRERVPLSYWHVVLSNCVTSRAHILITRCFCHRVADPSPPRLVTPHSCAYSCSRDRASGCGHGCPLLCHPGPCPPCGVTVRKSCWCGREVSSIRCSSLASPNSAAGVSCNLTCGKPLSCGNPQHTCAQICHPGDCNPCMEVEVVACYCGKEKKDVPCGDRKDKVVVCAVEGEVSWEGRYECGGVCGR
jgi:transcriptional repressor NF-X1